MHISIEQNKNTTQQQQNQNEDMYNTEIEFLLLLAGRRPSNRTRGGEGVRCTMRALDYKYISLWLDTDPTTSNTICKQ